MTKYWNKIFFFLKDKNLKYTMKDNKQFKTIIAFDYRGMEPVEFSPRNGWKVCGYKEFNNSMFYRIEKIIFI